MKPQTVFAKRAMDSLVLLAPYVLRGLTRPLRAIKHAQIALEKPLRQ